MQLPFLRRRAPHSERGFVFLVALALILGLTVLVTATQVLVVQQMKTSKSERDYEHALQMAEAGVHAYMNRLNSGAAGSALIPPLYTNFTSPLPTIQQFKQGVRNGTYTLRRYPAGSQQGYFVGTVGTPAPPTYSTKIVSYGWSHGVVRRVVATARSASGDYALYGIQSVDIKNNIRVNGNVGSNGQVALGNNNVINGHLALWGSSAACSVGNNSVNRLVHMPAAMDWPTVDEIILQKWPNSGSTRPGGWRYLETHNDNSLARINGAGGIPGARIALKNSGTVVLRGKAGGANYYVTDVACKNNLTVTLDNALGPINLWIGPNGTYGGFDAKNNLSITQTSTDPAKPCRIYCGSYGGVTLKNNAGALAIYAYNIASGYGGFGGKVGTNCYDGEAIGSVTIKNNATVNGNIIANTIEMQNNETVNYTPGSYFQPSNPWSVTNRWAEFE